MKLQWTKSFVKDYQKLPQQIQKQTDKKPGFLLQDISHPSLRVKKVQGSIRGKKVSDVYELSVTMNYRLFFQIQNNVYVLLAIGTHKEILGR
ncbi:type II toxin-antitoxin system mRNA interferase toxin, RelE/StbE family [candidate division KSB1 bacterium]|nr:type II toxin-antitoxin system mRNA interferase toxin, RelE/StbE family [candidate division KSB1 bacterium]NIR69237.1 type II toxin-antitoxin system mRNA interferase toxin, RelE/StbE family [candidate division KSB1 bacterium]NIS27411.1 type II toxin-antitoxin system mRNA interferase toxin, RelE/StbE family [candidate division KSB1 bacterium]NIT74236.1 type II toxin-antitoxin system mRNA interferase toxin, RelE/StbE family [candidate division KSB1 bacterium]NIU28128.1 type II toxin-antitoxin 